MFSLKNTIFPLLSYDLINYLLFQSISNYWSRTELVQVQKVIVTAISHKFDGSNFSAAEAQVCLELHT